MDKTAMYDKFKDYKEPQIKMLLGNANVSAEKKEVLQQIWDEKFGEGAQAAPAESPEKPKTAKAPAKAKSATTKAADKPKKAPAKAKAKSAAKPKKASGDDPRGKVLKLEEGGKCPKGLDLLGLAVGDTVNDPKNDFTGRIEYFLYYENKLNLRYARVKSDDGVKTITLRRLVKQ